MQDKSSDDILLRNRMKSLKWQIDFIIALFLVPFFSLTGIANIFFMLEKIAADPALIARHMDHATVYKVVAAFSLASWFVYAGALLVVNLLCRRLTAWKHSWDYRTYGDGWSRGIHQHYQLYLVPKDFAHAVLVPLAYGIYAFAIPTVLCASFEINYLFLLLVFPLLLIVACKLREVIYVFMQACPKIEIDRHPVSVQDENPHMLFIYGLTPHEYVTISLVCNERIRERHGRTTSYHFTDLHRNVLYENESDSIHDCLKTAFSIPPNSAPTQISFNLQNNERTVEWTIEVDQTIKNTFRRRLEYGLVVVR